MVPCIINNLHNHLHTLDNSFESYIMEWRSYWNFFLKKQRIWTSDNKLFLYGGQKTVLNCFDGWVFLLYYFFDRCVYSTEQTSSCVQHVPCLNSVFTWLAGQVWGPGAGGRWACSTPSPSPPSSVSSTAATETNRTFLSAKVFTTLKNTEIYLMKNVGYY